MDAHSVLCREFQFCARSSAQDLVPPYLDVLITKLLGLLQNGQKLVQEGALTAMASVADCAKDKFVTYYHQVGVPVRAVSV